MSDPRDKLIEQKIKNKKTMALTNCQTYWDKFYYRNSDHFFKDRFWVEKEFDFDIDGGTLLEIGCGVGNLIIPLLYKIPNLYVIGIDFSEKALNILQSKLKELKLSDRCHLQLCDISCDKLDNLRTYLSNTNRKINYVSAIFTMSAISPEYHKLIVSKIYSLIDDKVSIYFRDYGYHDQAQKRFDKTSTISEIKERQYMRQDGTLSYFFTTSEVDSIFQALPKNSNSDPANNSCNDNTNGNVFVKDSNFIINGKCKYVQHELTNVKEGIFNIPRIFVQAKYEVVRKYDS